MTKIRRYFESNQSIFLTHVTHQRKPLLIENVNLLHSAIKEVNLDYPITIIAWVIIPDHFHMIIESNSSNVSEYFKRLKLIFSAKYRIKNKLKSGRIWQYRFWDHIIRNQDDLNSHIDYIHYNPVKHCLIDDPFQYNHSSLMSYYKEGIYESDWGVNEEKLFDRDFGE
ncbi:MAG: transposase [Candidatus Zixiibacteriota bacterium]